MDLTDVKTLPVQWEQVGNCSLAYGDCIDAMIQLDSASVSCVIADPPYCSGGLTRTSKKQSTSSKYQSADAIIKYSDYEGDARDERSFMMWSILWMRAVSRCMLNGSTIMVFTDWRQLANTCDALQVAGFIFRGIIVWDKKNSRPQPNAFRADCEFIVWASKGNIDRAITDSAVYLPGIYSISPPAKADRYHMNQKPYALIENLMKICPCGGVVMDPFMGSGTSGVAAIKMGHPFIGVEQSAHYYGIARDRITEESEKLRLF